MNPSTPLISPLRQRMIEDMRLRKLNGKTQITYVRAVRRLAGFLRRSPDTATGEDQRDDLGPEVLLRDHARARRADGDDESGARTAQVACGAEPRGGRPADRGS